MTIQIFFLIIAVQIILAVTSFFANERRLSFFALSSIAVNALLIVIFEIKLHHYIRNNFGVPNTIFYLISLILLLAFFWFFREQIMQNQFILIILSGLLWITSGSIDLLSDRGLLPASVDSFESALLIAGSITYLLFYIQILLQNRLITRVYKNHE